MTIAADMMDIRFERRSTMVTRRVAGEVILVPLTPRMGEEAALYTLDEIAAFLWDRLDGTCTGRDLVGALGSAYVVDQARAEQDVRVFLEQLKALDAIQPGEKCKVTTDDGEQ